MRLRTALCDLLGIEYPIVQSGMGSVAGPDMVAEVSRAGGLGVLGALGVPPDELRARIRRVRSLTDRPFGVNLWLHSELRPPVPASQLPDAAVHAVHVSDEGAATILKLCLENKVVASIDANPGNVKAKLAAGYKMINVGWDFGLLQRQLNDTFKSIRSAIPPTSSR